ncbi:MAG TPA: hypothetical protein VFJ50_00440, partial [Gemmatimonadales bacterium]|nr:hypothetical protein [Gemmatimonadales bacterium]
MADPLSVLSPDIRSQIDSLASEHAPRSIFAYGSATRANDNLIASDLELGVIAHLGATLSRRKLAETVTVPRVRVYVFDEQSLRRASPRVPFNARLFVYELAITARTVFGAPVAETLPVPQVRALDLYGELRFNVGRCVQALMASRSGADALAADGFAKSVLYGARAWLVFEQRRFPESFAAVARLAR